MINHDFVKYVHSSKGPVTTQEFFFRKIHFFGKVIAIFVDKIIDVMF